MESNTNKYDMFFESILRFALKTRLTDPEDNEGAGPEEIRQFEQTYQVKYPIVFHSFFKYFGKKARIRCTDYDFYLTFSDLEKTLIVVKDNNYYPFRQKGEKVIEFINRNNYMVNYDNNYPNSNIGEYTPPIKDLMAIRNITFFQWDGDRTCFNFFDYTQENPIVFHFMEFQKIVSDFMSFTDYLRSSLYLAINMNIQTEFTRIYERSSRDRGRLPLPPIDYTGIEWLKDYAYIHKNKIGLRERKLYRVEYYKLNKEREQEENRILTIDEFETGFLNYLREKGLKF